mgnify:CR=1 FL=1
MLKEQIKPEMHQSVVELGTEICDSIVERARTTSLICAADSRELAGRAGLRIASVGTHPFSHWRDQLITEGERYQADRRRTCSCSRARILSLDCTCMSVFPIAKRPFT